MSTRKSSLVIGAGLGGIATAARLARQGYDVTVVEKNTMPGGRCGQLVKDGHRFDTGPTLFLIPEMFAETYTALGECMEDHLDLRRIDPTYRFYYDDGIQLTITTDLSDLQAQLEVIEPGSFGRLLNYLAEGKRHYDLAVRRLAGRNFDSLLEYFSPQNLLLLFKLKALINHYAYVGSYFRSPYLKAAFTFQDMYLGLSPFDAPATYSLLQYTELIDGVWFPIGGMYRIVESLALIAKANGVQFRYNAPVAQINVNGGHVSGVTLQDGSRLNADLVIANADLPYVYNYLLPHKADAERLERLKYTCSAIMFYWGVDKVYSQLGVHNLFVAGDYRASFDCIFRNCSLPTEPNFYIHAPARVDPTAAPPNQDTLMVLVPSGRLDGNDQDWKALQAQARAAVLRRLSDMGLTDLEEHIKFEVSYTPPIWRNMYNLHKGAAFGSINHTIWQVGYLRPHNSHRRYENLYFVGGSTHPGNGLPLALTSARLTTERIQKENGLVPA